MRSFFSFVIPAIFTFSSFTISAQSLPWQLESQVPVTDIYSINKIAGELYVSEGDRIHYSSNAAGSWSISAALTPSPAGSSDLTLFNGRLYAASYGQGVFVSQNNGATWSQLNAGLGSQVPMKFAMLNGRLYVATDDNGVYQLNPAGTQWNAFNSGLAAGGWGSGFNCLTTCGNSLVGGVSANGYVVYFQDTASVWKGATLTGAAVPGLTTYDLLHTGNYLWAVTNNKVFASANQGLSWTPVATGMSNGFYGKTFQVSGMLYVAVNYSGGFRLYRRSIFDPLNAAWTLVDTFLNHTVYGMEQVNSRFFVATSLGLYYLDNLATGLEEQPQKGSFFTLMPNPAADRLELTLPVAGGELKVYDLQGRELLKTLITGQHHSLDVSMLAEGVYYARLNGLGCKLVIRR